jgi:SAM-dependent methyltransferase
VSESLRGFDVHAADYENAIERAVAFSGQSHQFFLESKARVLLELIERRLGNPRSVRALDVGCGPGLLDRLITPAIPALVGVDVSAQMIGRARATNPQIDLAFAACVLHHVPTAQRPALLEEMVRVVRPGGLVVIFEHNPLNPLTRMVVRSCGFDEGVALMSHRLAVRLLERSGTRSVESRFILFFPWRNRSTDAMERTLRRLPLGAQYMVAAQRPQATQIPRE